MAYFLLHGTACGRTLYGLMVKLQTAFKKATPHSLVQLTTLLWLMVCIYTQTNHNFPYSIEKRFCSKSFGAETRSAARARLQLNTKESL